MKLYVGNLPYNTDEAALRELFATYGTPDSVTVVVDRMTGRSRGFAFVEIADPEQAKAAIAGVNGKELGGRTLVVNEARPEGGGRGGRGGPRGDFGGRGSGRGGFGGGRRGY